MFTVPMQFTLEDLATLRLEAENFDSSLLGRVLAYNVKILEVGVDKILDDTTTSQNINEENRAKGQKDWIRALKQPGLGMIPPLEKRAGELADSINKQRKEQREQMELQPVGTGESEKKIWED